MRRQIFSRKKRVITSGRARMKGAGIKEFLMELPTKIMSGLFKLLGKAFAPGSPSQPKLEPITYGQI